MTTPAAIEEPKPTGRQAVRAAVLEAASALFAARGIAAVSIRDVAARAGVNHGLLHRHFGGKAELVREVMDTLAAELAHGMEIQLDLEALSLEQQLRATDSPYFRLLAHALLEGHDPAELQAGFPVVKQLVAAVRREQRCGELDAEPDARLLVALGVATGLGWMLFEPFLLTATGLGRRARWRVRNDVFQLCGRLVRAGLRPLNGTQGSQSQKEKTQ